ncbi:MAG: DUF3078 domain-containing protein [Salinivirgaceae bacterium]
MQVKKITKYLLIIALISIGFTAFAQNKKNAKKTEVPNHYQHVIDYFKHYPPQSSGDSLQYQAFNYLYRFNTSDSLKLTINQIQELINENKAYHQIPYLFDLRHKIDSLNTLRNKTMQDYWERQRLQSIADTSHTASEDSLFVEIMDAVFYQDTINIDSIFKALSPFNDSLIHSINQVIHESQNNEMIQWIKQIRRDTVNFYVVDVEGDSVLVRLYENSPEMIKFSVTDYWGNSMKAVLRDIERNSFRILVDDTPELNYQTDEKAKKAIGGLGKMSSTKKSLTLSRIPIDRSGPTWIYGGNVNVDLSQIHLSESWVKGGVSAISFMTGLELFANYKKGNATWENRSVFKYGAQRQDGVEDFRPTEDRLEFYTKYGHKAFGDYFISAISDFKTQFGKAYEYPNADEKNLVAQILSPAYLTFALGLDYKPNKNTTLFLSPVTSRSTFVMNDAIDKTKYGLDTTKNSRHETGAIFKASYKTKVWGNIQIENQVELFSNYIAKPQNIDIDWDLKLILPVNDFIRATISTRLIYDDDQLVPKFEIVNGEKVERTTKAIQFKELMTIGFAMKF